MTQAVAGAPGTTIARLRGSFPPLVTPFRDGRVDLEAYEALVDHHIAGGSHGILVNGTSAEPSTLSPAERNALVDVAVKSCAGRLPVVAATGSQSLEETLSLSQAAERAGADALLVVTPYYIRPPQRGLVDYFSRVCERVECPVLVYHIPGRAAVSVQVDTLARICEQRENLVGVKHASTDLGFVTRALRTLGRDFRIFAGLEELSLPMLAVGACGLMNAVGNVDPGRVAALVEAVESGDLERARELHFALSELFEAVFFETNPIPLKYMLRKLGVLPTSEHRPPMCSAEPELERRLDAVLRGAGLA